jgi:hypothetical protein
MSVNRFEEYKLFVEDTARFTDRRLTVNNIYVAVNSAVLAAVAFLGKDAGFLPSWRTGTLALVLVAGIVICLQWIQLIGKYKGLVKLRMDQLHKMEVSPEMAGCWQMYHKEDDLYPRDEKGNLSPGKSHNISDLERWLPAVFIIVYAIFLLGCLAGLTFAPGWLG